MTSKSSIRFSYVGRAHCWAIVADVDWTLVRERAATDSRYAAFIRVYGHLEACAYVNA